MHEGSSRPPSTVCTIFHLWLIIADLTMHDKPRNSWNVWFGSREENSTGSPSRHPSSVDKQPSSTSTLSSNALGHLHAGGSASSSGSSASQRPSMETVAIQPHHVVLSGLAVVLGVGSITGLFTYWGGAKSLRADGINPATRRKVIPLAAQTLVLSTVLTGALGLAGFTLMKEFGVFKTDRAELPSAREAAKLMRDPRAYIREIVEGKK